MDAFASLTSAFEGALADWHRPATLLLNWGEYDEAGETIDFHEGDRVPVAGWDEIRDDIRALATKSTHRVGVASVFVQLDLRLEVETGEQWFDRAGEVSFFSADEPHRSLNEILFSYTTYVDAWLTVTEGENGEWRANHGTAERNRPRLEATLAALTRIAGRPLEVEPNRFSRYVTPTGFLPADDRPERGKALGRGTTKDGA